MTTTAEQVDSATSIEDLPPLWGEVASLAGTVPLVDVSILAGHFKRPKKEIERILAHPAVAEHVEYLKAEIALRVGKEAGTLTEARSSAIQKIAERLQDDDIPLPVLIKTAQFLCDYNPDRKFVKIEKREEHRTVEHTIREHTLLDIKARALENFRRVPVELIPAASVEYTEADPDERDDFSEAGICAIEKQLEEEGVLS